MGDGSGLGFLERDRRIGIVLLGRPYHYDPGINHGILEEFQKRGFPIFTQQSLPLEPERQASAYVELDPLVRAALALAWHGETLEAFEAEG